MKVESMVRMEVHRIGRRFLEGFAALAVAATFLLIPAAANAADPRASGPAGQGPVVTVEKIPGKEAPRVILSAKAAERLGIETGKVGEQVVVHKQMVSGVVIPPMDEKQVAAAQPRPMLATFGFGDSGKGTAAPGPGPVGPRPKSPEPGDLWVLVTLSPGEWNNLAKDKPVRLLPLATRDNFPREVLAQPSGVVPVEDIKRLMLSLYYVVSGKDHGLTVNNRVRVELQLGASAETRKVVPYSAVYYDARGAAWVYVNTRPLTYERQRIAVERIEGDLAVLSDGPPVGTPVVTVGAPLLHGAEIFKK